MGGPAARLPNGAACAPRCWRSATARWGSGPRCAKCSRKPSEQRCWFHKICECSCRAAEVGASWREEGARGDLERRGQTPRPRRGHGVRSRLRCEVSQGGRQDHRRHRAAARRSTTTRPNIGCICERRIRSSRPSRRCATAARSPRARIPRGRNRHGIQADRSRAVTLARRQRTPPRRACPSRRTFENGKLVERPDEPTTEEAA